MRDTSPSTKILYVLLATILVLVMLTFTSFTIIEFIVTGRLPVVGFNAGPLLTLTMTFLMAYVLVDWVRVFNMELLSSKIEQIEASSIKNRLKLAEQTLEEDLDLGELDEELETA